MVSAEFAAALEAELEGLHAWATKHLPEPTAFELDPCAFCAMPATRPVVVWGCPDGLPPLPVELRLCEEHHTLLHPTPERTAP
jgi:hypothetical protein